MKKLVKVQKELKANKSRYNSFGKYSYRSCEDILEAVKPLLAANDLCLTITDDLVMIGNRFYIKSIATVTDGEGYISCTGFAREEDVKKGMDSAQITGSCSSYARKYALNGLFLTDDSDDADSHDNRETGKKIDSAIQKADTVLVNPLVVEIKKIARRKKLNHKMIEYFSKLDDSCLEYKQEHLERDSQLLSEVENV